jgi:hypothetical protein
MGCITLKFKVNALYDNRCAGSVNDIAILCFDIASKCNV